MVIDLPEDGFAFFAPKTLITGAKQVNPIPLGWSRRGSVAPSFLVF
jgi:hypothetical protein